MGFLFTTTELLESIKDRAHAPASQSTYTTARLLSIASDELLTYVVPMILSTQEDYYVTYKDYTATGTTSFTLPDRAIGGKLKDVVLVNSAGDEAGGVKRIDQSQRDQVSGLYCFLRGNNLILSETAIQPTLRIYYHTRPSRLIELTDCGKVTSLGASSVDLDLVPSDYTTSVTYDVVSGTAPHPVRQLDVTATVVEGTTVTFATLPTVSINDYLCASGESPVVQCPYELVGLLAQKVACKIMEAQGDLQGLQASSAELARMEKAAFKLLEPRIDSQTTKVLNRGSDLRGLPRKWSYINRV